MSFAGRVILASHVYEQLRSSILQGEIGSGERLTEARLAKRLGVSRTPIREALGRLEAEGLVTREGAGLVAIRVDLQAASDALLLRELIEPFCAETSAANLSPSEARRLSSLVAEMKATLQSGDDDKKLVMADLNLQFHDTLYGRCPHPRLLAELRRSRDHYVTYWLYDWYTNDDFQRSVREHGEIAVLAGDVAAGKAKPSELGKRLKLHIARAREIFEKKIKQTEQASSAQKSAKTARAS